MISPGRSRYGCLVCYEVDDKVLRPSQSVITEEVSFRYQKPPDRIERSSINSNQHHSKISKKSSNKTRMKNGKRKDKQLTKLCPLLHPLTNLHLIPLSYHIPLTLPII